MAFHCTIVTPEHQLLDETVTQVIIPAHDGEIGILTDRAPLLVQIGAGQLRADMAGGRSMAFYIEGGVAQMNDNNLSVLTDNAVPIEQLTAEDARKSLAAANALPATDPNRTRSIQRALAKQRLAKS